MTDARPMEGRWPLRWSAVAAIVLLLAMLAGAYQLRFLCDDAFITFRYVSNARDGFGLVWNRPPFEPVEGYTGFLWALLLWAVWSWFGVEPPDSANALSMLCGVLQFAVLVATAHAMRRRDGRRVAPLVAWATVAAIVGNRTFLQWMTGGLETALFNLGFLGWAVAGFRAVPAPRGAAWLAAWSGFAAMAALTRPDGLLLVAATGAVALISRRTWQLGWRALLLGLSPLATVAGHLMFRRGFYGEWLPNTYYAKVLDPWPEAGWRYLLCFGVEHGLWLWAPMAAAGVAGVCWSVRRSAWRSAWANLAPLCVVGATAIHAAYYVLKVGGDHFEYRVFSHLVPLTVLSAAAMASRWSVTSRLPLAAVLSLWLASCVGWAHLALTRDMPANGFHPLAPRVPSVLQPLARWYDRHQSWLQMHYVCLRCVQHALALQYISAPLPPRSRSDFDLDDVPVHATVTVGMAGWVLPDCAILDKHGLNDWVIAHAPAPEPLAETAPDRLMAVFTAADADGDGWIVAGELRAAVATILKLPEAGPWADPWVEFLLGVAAVQRSDALTLGEARWLADVGLQRGTMAHERVPPPGYVEAFDPNVHAEGGAVRIVARSVPLTADRVSAIEAAWRDWVRAGAPADGRPGSR
jgi:arabinofuranosyltransferase